MLTYNTTCAEMNVSHNKCSRIKYSERNLYALAATVISGLKDYFASVKLHPHSPKKEIIRLVSTERVCHPRKKHIR